VKASRKAPPRRTAEASVGTNASSGEKLPGVAKVSTRDVAKQLDALLRRISSHRPVEPQPSQTPKLSLTQWRTLRLLASARQARTVTQLAETVGVSCAAMSRAVESLRGQQLVTRAESEVDRRPRWIQITDAGLGRVQHVSASEKAALIAFAASLSPSQRQQLHAALVALGDPSTAA
jgi:DNA-binding MarR family transcriptional regulator